MLLRRRPPDAKPLRDSEGNTEAGARIQLFSEEDRRLRYHVKLQLSWYNRFALEPNPKAGESKSQKAKSRVSGGEARGSGEW